MTTKHLTNKSHALIRRRIAFFLIGSFALAASARQSQLPPNGDPPATNQPAADRASSAAIIPEVVVTATRTKEEVRNISQSITVLTHDDIERQQALTPNEMLMEQPGIWSVQVPAQGSPIIRGQIGNRVLYLWDGIPINTGAIFAGPNGYFNQVPVGAVDRMEVIRGPGSVQYGSDAIGGVINIISKKADEFPSQLTWGGDSSARVGTVNGETTEIGDLWAADSKFNVMAGVSSQVAGNSRGPGVGTMENTGFDVYGGYVNAAYQPLTHQVLRLSVIYGDRNPVDYYAQSKLNKDGIPRIFDPYEQRGIGKLSYEMDQLGALSSELKLYTYYHGYRQLQDRQPETVTATNTVLNNTKTKTAQDIVGGGIQNVTPWSTSWGDHKFVYGMDGRAENLRSSHLLYTTTTPPDTTTVTDPFGITPNGTYDVFDLFAMTELHPHETWTVSLGGRFENTHLHANPVAADVIPNAGYTLNDLKVDKTWDSLTWNAGAVHALNPQLDLAANIATGYRAPTFSDTLSTGTPVYSSKIASVPSPNVRPEQSITYEFGPRYHSQRWNVSLTGYWNQLWDVVTAVTNGTVYIPGQGTFAAQHNNNSGHGYVRGAEFAASCRLGDGWTVFGNATYTQGWDEGNSVYYRFIPPLNGNLGLRYESPCGRWWAEVVEVMVDTLWRHAPGDQQDSGFSTDPGYGSPSASNPPLNSHYQIPGYVVTNLRGGVRVWQGAHHERVDLTLDVNNLFDTSYREAYAQQELVAPGLNVVVGAKMTF